MYIGRFAPSPTGPLHFGSLVAALASYLAARAAGGRWLLRMEDLDRARSQAGAAETILSQLEALGLQWDGAVLFQSRCDSLYRAAFDELTRRGLTYPCGCSRREVADSAVAYLGNGPFLAPDGAPIYPGTCRNGVPPGKTARATRVRTGGEPIGFVDAIQGEVVQALDREVGDFVLYRADGTFSYQLAVVVDDAAQGITDVVRGADLLDSTARQIYLQQLLGYPQPRYAHLPVAVNAQGEKLSKQTGARAVDVTQPGRELARALAFLGHPPPGGLTAGELLVWALENWSLARVPRRRAIAVPEEGMIAPG
ncbi:MAG TPA: tRNA glutamyl-Q(34) synthetase GluQRS [Burkholderiales bacterium]|nr:tRNA glutamyl-Q(34) synthetase GluQRS [Burkholderiales bacterium]